MCVSMWPFVPNASPVAISCHAQIAARELLPSDGKPGVMLAKMTTAKTATVETIATPAPPL